LPTAIAADKKRQKHVCASMLNLQSHPVWARINLFADWLREELNPKITRKE
jgi:hypothetical protein